MTDDHTTGVVTSQDAGAAAKDPSDWTTGDEPMTGPQRSYPETLLQQAGREAPEDLDRLSKAEASRRIDELQDAAGRVTEPLSAPPAPPGVEPIMHVMTELPWRCGGAAPRAPPRPPR